MVHLSYQYTLGIVLTFLMITIAGVYSGKKVKETSDFSGKSRSAGSLLVAGTVIGTFAGGSSTIGTAQLAFLHGLSAWWFTLGGGFACLIFALFFSNGIYNLNKETIPQIIAQEYGGTSKTIASSFIMVGTFINVSAQILAAASILTTMLEINMIMAVVLSSVFICIYVFFGGIWGTSIVGIMKVIMVYISVIACAIMALRQIGGVTELMQRLPDRQYLNIFGRGFVTDIVVGFTLVIGVLSNQTYYQAVLSGKTAKHSKNGLLLSSIIIPPVGIASVVIGVFMKVNYPNISSASVFAQFVLNFMGSFLSGVVMSTLFISLIGSGAGLTLGISTIYVKDIYNEIFNKNANEEQTIKIFRYSVVIIMILSGLFIVFNPNTLIIELSVMAMGIRGICVFFPICTTLFAKDRVSGGYIIASMIISPLIFICGNMFFPTKLNWFILSILMSLTLIILGVINKKYLDDKKMLHILK